MERPIIGKKVKDFTFDVYCSKKDEVKTRSLARCQEKGK
jgi:hypothetical protein